MEKEQIHFFDFIRADGFITVNKKIAKIIGLYESIIYGELVSRYIYFKEHNKLDEQGYFYNTIEDLQEATTLSRYNQDTSIKTLKRLGLIKTKVKGVPPKRYFAITEIINISDFEEKIYCQFVSQSQIDLQTTDKSICKPVATNKNKENKKKEEEKSIEYRTPNLENSESQSFDFLILEQQIIQCYPECDTSFKLKEVIKVFKYFIDKHKHHCKFEHPKTSNESIKDIIDNIAMIYSETHGDIDIDVECYKDMIDFYWQQAVKHNFKGNGRDTINYSISHFMSNGIRVNCYYKTYY